MNDQVIIFDLKSKFASFRKIDTNSSSLTYGFPPRTTIMGLIAAMIGRDRDSYYQEFFDAEIAIRIKVAGRQLFQSINNVMIKNVSDTDLYNKAYQTTIIPTQFLVPNDYKESIRYRIYFSVPNVQLFNEIRDKLENNITEYPLSLGYANMPCKAHYIAIANKNKVSNEKNSIYQVVTPVALEEVEDLSVVLSETKPEIQLLKDTMPFLFDSDRIPKHKKYIYEISGNPIPLRLKSSDRIYEIEYLEEGDEMKEVISLL